MRRNAADRDCGEDPGELTPAQEIAVAALTSGASVTGAAEAAGVNRATVHRWMSNPIFRAALNRARLEVRQSALNRAASLADAALSVIEKSLGEGNPKTALGLLRGLGILAGSPAEIGSGDPRVVALDQRRRQSKHTTDVAMADMADSLSTI